MNKTVHQTYTHFKRTYRVLFFNPICLHSPHPQHDCSTHTAPVDESSLSFPLDVEGCAILDNTEVNRERNSIGYLTALNDIYTQLNN